MSGFLAVLYWFLVAIHILVCVVMMLSILLQAGKSAGLGAGFGGASQTLFGAGGGASFLAKFTATCAIIFVLTSVAIAKVATPGDKEFEKKAKKMAVEKNKAKKAQEVKLDEVTPEEAPITAVPVPPEEVPQGAVEGTAGGAAAAPPAAPEAGAPPAAPPPPNRPRPRRRAEKGRSSPLVHVHACCEATSKLKPKQSTSTPVARQ